LGRKVPPWTTLPVTVMVVDGAVKVPPDCGRLPLASIAHDWVKSPTTATVPVPPVKVEPLIVRPALKVWVPAPAVYVPLPSRRVNRLVIVAAKPLAEKVPASSASEVVASGASSVQLPVPLAPAAYRPLARLRISASVSARL
jgi:hypothetical protein